MELKKVKGVGEKNLYYLNQAGIFTIDDLLFKFPLNYIIYEQDKDKLFNGELTYVEGTICSNVSMYKYKGRSYAFSFFIENIDFKLKINLFTTLYAGVRLKRGMNIGIYGKYVKRDKYFSVRKIFTENFGLKIENEYKIKDILNSTFTRIVKNAITSFNEYEETLPQSLIDKYKLLNIKDYIYKTHFPNDKNDVIEVLRRRKYEEFFWYLLRLEFIKSIREDIKKTERKIDKEILNDFLFKLPFTLTEDQKKVLFDIEKDILSSKPMNRLVQGDVGCGKSIISLYSAFALITSGYQAAIMVPTELLAIQQFKSAKEYLSKYGIIVELLTSSKTKKEKNDILERLQSGRINLIIGTHSLIEDNVKFGNLGIVIIDEQHKFGVKQRQKLIDKYKYTDCLYLTATPIPRSLGLTIFGDLDISSIHAMPEGRLQTITKIVKYSQIKGLMKSISNELNKNNQIYVVTPLIDDLNELNIMDVNKAYNLFKDYFPDKKILVVHGKMKDEEKNKNMIDFSERRADILISTTVIEVGVNVKKATVMVICDADRFGLAGLHQLRGRVGRSIYQSYCILLTNDPLNERLKTIEGTTDGFKIAEADLKQRGPGDYLGESQSGFFALNYVDFYNDIKIYECAKEDAKYFLPKFKKKEIESNIFNDIIKNEVVNRNKNN